MDSAEAASEIAGRTILNARQIRTTGPEKSWAFVRYSFLRPDVLHLELVEEKPLRDVEQEPASLRAALERLDGQSGLYDDFCVCVRVKTEDPPE